MGSKAEEFRVEPGNKVKLDQWPTEIKVRYDSDKDYESKLNQSIEETSDLQRRLYASNSFALLLIFQAMDAAGKDGAIRHVMSGINPQGCHVYSFKQPSPEELEHDFLWRTARCMPERGKIVIFNRSYYEEVLIVRVHPEFLEAQGISASEGKQERFWQERYQSIVESEQHLHRSKTRILKFFLHLSKDEQRKRLLKRIDDPAKNWKFNAGDIEERKLWTDYQKAYEECLSATSTKNAPWYVVPADDKKNARLIISQIILDTLTSLDLRYPESTAEQLEELKACRKLLEK